MNHLIKYNNVRNPIPLMYIDVKGGKCILNVLSDQNILLDKFLLMKPIPFIKVHFKILKSSNSKH